MLNRILSVCILVLAAWAGSANAGGIVKRTDATVFSALSVGQSARAVGMGSAYTSISNDVNALWWNPAGVAHIERMEVSFTHTQWFVNSKFNVGAAGFRWDQHAFALGIMSFDPGTVMERTILEPQGTGRELSLGTVSVSGAYARKLTDKLSFGLRAMWAHEDLDLTDYATFNLDFGTLFYTGFRSLRLSMAMRNFGKDTEVQRRAFQQPLTFNIGGAGEIYGNQGDPVFVTASFEMNFAINYEERFHMGGEAWIWNMLALRGGYMSNYDAFDFTAGAGLKVPYRDRHMVVDVAWQKAKNGMNVPMRLSVGFGL